MEQERGQEVGEQEKRSGYIRATRYRCYSILKVPLTIFDGLFMTFLSFRSFSALRVGKRAEEAAEDQQNNH